VLENHAAKTASGIVLKAGDILVKALLQAAEDGRELLDELVGVGVLDEATNGVSSVGLGLGVLIAQAVNEKLEEARSKLGCSRAHAIDALSEDTHSGSTLDGLGAASVAQDNLLEDFPQLRETLTESCSHAGNNVESSVDNDPVKLGGLFTGIHILFNVLELARVLLGDDICDHRDDIVQSSLIGDQGGAAEAEVLRHVAVDVGDGRSRLAFVSNPRPKPMLSVKHIRIDKIIRSR
jgi:hypothetical protein